ncbi:hypothetical protein MJ391_23380 [Escherichia coli]|nr:hypothetical protein MJ391_23380 [Escherichia coli]
MPIPPACRLLSPTRVNIVSADFFGLGFSEYASVMVPVDIAAIVASRW